MSAVVIRMNGRDVLVSRGNAVSILREEHRRAIRQARVYHGGAFAGGPNFSGISRTEFRRLARLNLARAAFARRQLVTVLAGA